MKYVELVCDGSSLGNGQVTEKRAAAAALLSCDGHMRAVGRFLGSMSNQQAEMMAAIVGLEALRGPCHIHLMTDSRYVVETMRGSFKKKANHDLWERLERAAHGHTIRWEWVRGHAGHRQQESVDRLARTIARLGYVTEMLLTETVNKLRGEVTPAQTQAVFDGLRFLAGVCNEARLPRP